MRDPLCPIAPISDEDALGTTEIPEEHHREPHTTTDDDLTMDQGAPMTDDPRPSRFATLCPPPGIDRLREQLARDRYNRERAAAIATETGVSWPVDLGEAGA